MKMVHRMELPPWIGNTWFYGNMTSGEAEEELIKQQSLDGLFLVRNCNSAPGNYVLSVVLNGETSHLIIYRNFNDAYFSLFNEETPPLYHGLDKLIEHYSNYPINPDTADILTKGCSNGSAPPAPDISEGSCTLLHRATRERNYRIAKLIVESQPNKINERDAEGLTPIAIAVKNGSMNLVDLFLEANAQTDIRDKYGFTPLMHACRAKHAAVLEKLLKHSTADITARIPGTGEVALHEASESGSLECIQLLLFHGAPVRPRNTKGETPEKIAQKLGHQQCFSCLSNAIQAKSGLQFHDYFHGRIGRVVADLHLGSHSCDDGTYLVRFSVSKPDSLVLSMVHEERYFHYEIERKDLFYYINRGPLFRCVTDLVEHYRRFADGLPCPLSVPVKPKTFEAEVNNSQVSNNTSTEGCTTPYIITSDAIEIGTLLGEGEFGEVYKGTWMTTIGEKIDVAVKTLGHTDVINQVDFLREAKTMTCFNFPYIVKLFGICKGPPIVMVQEFSHLGSLLNYLLDNDIQDSELCNLSLTWAVQIADGMFYLESKGFVHRDLACRNILMFAQDLVKISDFGLSRAVDCCNNYYISTKGGKWPIKWYAVESVNNGIFSHQSDVWSYAVTLWEIYTKGDQPYGSMCGREVIELLMDNERLPQPDLCPTDVYQLLLKCWSEVPKDRPRFSQLVDFFRFYRH